MIYRSKAVFEAELITSVERVRLDLFSAKTTLVLANGKTVEKETSAMSAFSDIAPLAERGDYWVNIPRMYRGTWRASWQVVSAEDFPLMFEVPPVLMEIQK